jgi:hypothetical protein
MSAAAMDTGAAAPVVPVDLRARLVRARGEAIALVPVLARVVEVYREAVGTVPVSWDIWEYDAALARFMVDSGADVLAELLEQCGALVGSL